MKQIGPGNALPLTKSPQDEVMCRWSPDGKWIAFLRQGEDHSGEVYVVPVLTGLEKKLGDATLQSGPRRSWVGTSIVWIGPRMRSGW